MEVVSLCPLRVATVTWRPSPHRLALTLICKATFRLEPDLSPLHRSQQAPCRKDQHWKGEPGRSLYAPTDLVPAKPRADVLLVGRARAPEAVPRASIVTRLHVGEIDKSIEAFGARFFLPGGRLVQAAKIAELPLRYEAAAGGPGTPNPVGIARSARDAQGRLVVPNLQPAGLRVAAPGDVVPSVGYGPIAPSWPARAAKLGPCAALFEADRWWATALPDGLDPSYFNAAPQDQQVSELHPDEEIVLENLVAGQPCLRTRLPGLRPVAVLQRQEGGRETPELVADTLFIDADQGMCTLTWRAQAPLWHLAEEGRIEVALEGERGEIHGGPVRAALAPRPSAPELWDEPSTDDPDGEVTEPTCPTLELPPARARARSAPPREELTPVATPLPGAVPREPLPFRRSEPPSRASAPGAPRPSAPSWDEEIALPEPPAPPDAGSTLDERLAPPARPSEPLPFRQPAPRAPVESTLDESELPPAVPSRPLPFGAPAPAAAAPLPPPPVPRLPAAAAPGPVPSRPGKAMSPWAAAARASGRVSSADRAGAASESAGAAELAGGGPPQPPPLIGPLATPEMVEREQAAATPAQVEAPAAPPGAEPDAGAPAPAGEPAAVVDLLSAEQCGAIAASLARRPDEAADILKESKLGPEAWKTIEAHWAEQIRDETGRGKARLLRAYDTAYVARLEEERGTIEVEQYARLVVAAERGQAAEVLRELSLPSGALVRIERVFLRRLVERPGLGERVRKAVEAARER